MNVFKKRAFQPRALAWLAAPAMVAAFSAAAFAAPTPMGTPSSGTLYFTTYQNQGGQQCGAQCTPDIFKVSYSYDGGNTAGSFKLSQDSTVGTTPGADGIVFTPNGQDLLIGGQQTGKVYEVNPTTGKIVATAASGGSGAFHLTITPNGKDVITSAEPGAPDKLPLNPLSTGSQWTLNGDTSQITQIAFIPGDTATAWYTDSSYTGGGSAGIINLATGKTTAVFKNEAWAHGVAYDSFTHDLIFVGALEMAQVNPSTGKLVATYTLPNSLNLAGGQQVLDQVIVNGKGQLFATLNSGNLVFMDYSTTGMISSPYYVTAPFLHNNLDDVAGQLPEVPFAGALILAVVPLGLWVRRRQSKGHLPSAS